MTTSDATKKDFFGTITSRNVLTRLYLKVSTKNVICALAHSFNKVNRGIVEKPEAVGEQNWPCRLSR